MLVCCSCIRPLFAFAYIIFQSPAENVLYSCAPRFGFHTPRRTSGLRAKKTYEKNPWASLSFTWSEFLYVWLWYDMIRNVQGLVWRRLGCSEYVDGWMDEWWMRWMSHQSNFDYSFLPWKPRWWIEWMGNGWFSWCLRLFDQEPCFCPSVLNARRKI